MDYLYSKALKAMDSKDRKAVIELQRQYIRLEQQFMAELNNGKRAILWSKMHSVEKQRWKLINKYY